MIPIERFDTKAWLQDQHIPFRTSGKNVSRPGSWIGVKCPFCFTPDPSEHLGINLLSNTISCWRCGTTGTIIRLVMELHDVDFRASKKILQKYIDVSILDSKRLSITDDSAKRPHKVKIPSEIKQELLPAYRQYLASRGFSPDYIFRKYKLMCGGVVGRWCHRLIIPVFQDRRMVSFLGRDITENKDVPKYRSLEDSASVLPIRQSIYNFDTLEEIGIIVEGPADVWRIGDGCVAVLGTKVSDAQINRLSQLRRAFIMFDSEEEAQQRAEYLGMQLSAVVPEVELIRLDTGDPAEMSETDVKTLRKEVFGKVF